MRPKTIVADLNVDPPDSDGEECSRAHAPGASTRQVVPHHVRRIDKIEESLESILFLWHAHGIEDLAENSSATKDLDVMEGKDKRYTKLKKCPSGFKGGNPLENGPDTDAERQFHGVATARGEKITSLKYGLVHVARKMPKNAHAHFILGLMYQRLGQPQKAVLAFEKSSEILLACDEEISRPELLSLVQIHHAQCLLQGSLGDTADEIVELEELEDVISKLKKSLQSDINQTSVWNMLGLILLWTGRLESAIAVLSSLLSFTPDNLDALANLGVAYLQSGNLELSEKCFQDLILQDQNHPAAFINFGALLSCKYGSAISGPGASADKGAWPGQVEAVHVAKECLEAALRADPKCAHAWMNLANAHYMAGDHQGAGRCFLQAAKLEPTRMSIRYASALHRIKDAERYQDPAEQLSWAANEMASILREEDVMIIQPQIALAGMAMVHRAQHEISSGFGTPPKGITELEEQAHCVLQQAVEVDPNDGVQWHQLGLHNLCKLQFKTSQKYLKAAVARDRECTYAWSNLGISLQLSEDYAKAEEVYKRAISLSTSQQVHAILSNLGNLYRQQKRFEHAKAVFAKSLELCPGYAPAYNNLGLVFVAEGRWEDAKSCFKKALEADSLLDAAKSNLMKAVAMSRECAARKLPVTEEKN